MPSISYDAYAAWSNYHLTIGRTDGTGILKNLRVERAGRLHADSPASPGVAQFSATAATLAGHLDDVLKQMKEKVADVQPLTQPFPAGLVGRGWSFSRLIGNETSQLDCQGLVGCALIDGADRHPACTVPAGHLAMVGGGVRLRELLNWAAPKQLSIMTSGTHLGPTLAGAIGSASHGSRLRYGGIQNIVRGLHLVTGTREQIWIERASAPVLSDAAAARLGADAHVQIIPVRDDEQFEDVLVHLGGVGIVNCVAVELVPDSLFNLVQKDRSVDEAWLEKLGAGAFHEVAAWLGDERAPEFYEATLDPHDWKGEHALHTLYLPAHPFLPPTGEPANIVRPSDAIALLASGLSIATLLALNMQLDVQAYEDVADSDASGVGQRVPMKLFVPGTETTSAFDFYREIGGFANPPSDDAYYWRELHRDEISGGVPGALHNASFAIERSRLADAVPAICAAVRSLPRLFVFTIRFVSEPAGTLAFTRFEENAVIEIDGLSRLACMLSYARLQAAGELTPEIAQLLMRLADVLEKGTAAVRKALDDKAIRHSMHWAKLGNLDRNKVFADYGDPNTDPHSLIKRWRETRAALLGPQGRALFWNEALVDFGLLDRPTQLPPLA